MAFEIELEYLIFADIEFVFDWWTDLSPQDTKLAKPLKSREIISKSPTQILLRDEEVILGRKMIFDVRVTLNSQEHSWIAEYSGKIAKATSEYKLISEQPSEDSRRVLSVTRLRYHTTVYPKGFFTTHKALCEEGVQRRDGGIQKGDRARVCCYCFFSPLFFEA
jgi:hypothetical protein